MAKIEKIETLHRGWGDFHIVTVRENDDLAYQRQVDDHGDSVGVVPYDPEAGTVILVRQLRAGPLFSERDAYILEIAAGLIDAGEPPETAARREAMEEVGIDLKKLEPLGAFYASPGVSTELMHLFLAPFTSADRVSEGGGAEDENENIEIVEVPLADVEAMLSDGRINDMKTFAALQALLASCR